MSAIGTKRTCRCSRAFPSLGEERKSCRRDLDEGGVLHAAGPGRNIVVGPPLLMWINEGTLVLGTLADRSSSEGGLT
jgi:hypothetical protein